MIEFNTYGVQSFNGEINMSRPKGFHHTEKTKKTMRESGLRWLETHPHSKLGMHHSEETKRKMSESAKIAGTGKWMLGIPKSEEQKKKMSLHNAWKGTHVIHSGSFKKGHKTNLGKKRGQRSETWRKKLSENRLKQIFPIKDTSIEIKIFNGLENLGYQFEKHKTLLNLTQADAFIEPDIVIFADGCYWHGCEECFNKNYFSERQRKQKIKDNLITLKLIKEGFKVLRLWEHDIEKNFENQVLDEIIFAVNETKIKGE